VESLLQWILKSFHDGGMYSLRYRGAGIFQQTSKSEDFDLSHVIAPEEAIRPWRHPIS
jgi:hypothetical protein